MAGQVAFGRSIQVLSKKSLKMSGIQVWLFLLAGNIVDNLLYFKSQTLFISGGPFSGASGKGKGKSGASPKNG
jgi:hypothetical protein